MPLPDDSPEKWEYKEHTRVKHDLLAKYLRAWISKLGSVHLRICYFDCFAGRGAYEGDVLGSPLIAMQLASREGIRDLYKELLCTFIEKNEENYNNLERLVKSEKETYPEQYKKIKVYCYNDAFVDVASQVIDEAGAKLAPSFFFIDPFGFGGVPFDLIRKILSIKRTEIFFTFMSRDINRFLESSAHESVLNKLFGTEKWREISKNYAGEERYHRLRDLYMEQLEDAGVQYTLAYKVNMDEKHQMLYHLIHATNHFDGFKIMKTIMYNQGRGGVFGYFGPGESQTTLLEHVDPIPSFKEYLLKRFGGCTFTFENVMKDSFAEHGLIEKHYRDALKALEKDGLLKIERCPPLTKKGKNRTGLDKNDKIIFP